MNIFLTGSTGFLGSTLLHQFITLENNVVCLNRKKTNFLPTGVKQVIGDLASISSLEIVRSNPTITNELNQALSSCDVVVHAAARAHIIHDEADDPLAENLKINRDATLTLARMASESGVKRFVFLSSIGVNGNQNTRPFSEIDEPNPHDPYSISKFEAEQSLLTLSKGIAMEVVIIRPPLIYGHNAPGNFSRLVKWVNKSFPLPFGAVNNSRSLIALDNVVDFIVLCADVAHSPKAANEVFLISDDADVSTSNLLLKVASAYGVKSKLFPFPVALMKFAARLLGKGAVADRLFGNLQIDNSKARNLLGWQPVTSMDAQLAKMAKQNIEKS